MLIKILNNKTPGQAWGLWDVENKKMLCDERFGFNIETLTGRNDIIKKISQNTSIELGDLKSKMLKIAIYIKTFFPNMRIEVENIEDIPTNSIDIKEINPTGLPKYNIVREAIDFVESTNHTYPEFAFQCATALLSDLAMRRLKFYMDGWYYTNLQNISLAIGGSIKSPVYNKIKLIETRVFGDDFFLSNPGSIHGLRSEIADEVWHLKKDKDGARWEAELRPPVTKGRRRAHCPLSMDEAGTFFAMLSQGYADGDKDFMNLVFGSNDSVYDRAIAGTKIKIYSIYTTKSYDYRFKI